MKKDQQELQVSKDQWVLPVLKEKLVNRVQLVKKAIRVIKVLKVQLV